jgi:predicted lipoprotein with Yx(FWY)xxD motif
VRRLGHLVVLLCVLAAGCGSEDLSQSSSRTDPTESPTPARRSSSSPSVPSDTTDTGTGITIITAASEFGPMLFDASGQPIYLFTAESGDGPACYGECAKDWPPVLTTDAPRGTANVRLRLLGSSRRTDGGTQVTYAGHPLYYYAHEGKYQVLCHDVEEYGGTWLVVRPDGTPAPG